MTAGSSALSGATPFSQIQGWPTQMINVVSSYNSCYFGEHTQNTHIVVSEPLQSPSYSFLETMCACNYKDLRYIEEIKKKLASTVHI